MKTIDRMKHGDRQAMDTLINAYYQSVFAYFYHHTAKRDFSMDLTQEVFIKVITTIGEYQNKGKFKSWLFTIAVNHLRNHWKYQSRHSECEFNENSELVYESMASGWESSQIRFCAECWDGGMDFEYSIFCGHKASHTFGCVSVRSGEYVILNKKYTKEEFYKLRDEIKKHMDEMPYIDAQGRIYKYGEFFPPEFSPFAYNDTITPEHFPLSKEEIINYGAKWYKVPKTEYITTMKVENIPDDIKNVSDNIINEIISCERCKRAYKIIPAEIQFLKQNNISLTPEIELESIDLLVEFARIGMGIAHVLKESAINAIDKGELFEVEIERKLPERKLGVATIPDVPLSRASLEFVKFLMQVL